MPRRFRLVLLLQMLAVFEIRAQMSLDNGFHNLEIGGSFSAFYNKRFPYSGNFSNRINDDPALGYDRSKDRFSLRDLQLQLEGRVGKDWEYALQVDFADMLNRTDVGENPGLLDANVTWKGPVHFTAGYQKIPYSRNSLVSFNNSPYWQRAELTRGEVFSRRDVGLLFWKSFWQHRINMYAGAFSGMGEQILSSGDGDPAGTLEYVSRVDVAWPARYRYNDYDLNHSPVPMVQLGAAARTVNRKYSSFLQGDDYYLRVIAGKKSCITADFSAQWQGFSAQVEWHRMLVKPTNDTDPSGTRYKESRGSFASKIGDNPTSFFRAGGFLATISYASKPMHSVFSVRYDQFNPNDLVMNNTEESLTFAWAYLIRGFNAAFKTQYSLRLVNRSNPLIQRFDDQLRMGLQFQFR